MVYLEKYAAAFLFFMQNIIYATALSSLSTITRLLPPNLEPFRHWHCVGIKSCIDTAKPYAINIGNLPLVIWKDRQNRYISTLNICKHMGSTLDKGRITQAGCLQCPYHGLEMTKDDQFGQIMEQDGKLFWSYLPKLSKPDTVPFEKNPNYVTSHLQVDMEASLLDSAYNTMDLRHPEFVHGNAIGFGSNIPPANIRHYYYPTSAKQSQRIGLSFDYSANPLINRINQNVGFTQNYHMYMYPYFSWSKVTFEKSKHLLIGVHLLPVGPNKTRWYITIRHNYYRSSIGKHTMKALASAILAQDYFQMRLQSKDSTIKRAVSFTHTFPDEDAILWLKGRFENYQYLSSHLCGELVKFHNLDKG